MERRFLALVAIAALAACTPPAGEPEEPPPEAGADVQAEDPVADPEPSSPAAIPACDDLLTGAELTHYFGDDAASAELLDTPTNWGPPAEHMADDALRPLLQQAADSRSCTWGMPATDNFFTVIIAPLTADLADQVDGAISSQGYPEMQPPTRGFSFNDDDSASTGVHLVEGDVWFVLQGGPGSINADDAQRHGFATILNAVADVTLG